MRPLPVVLLRGLIRIYQAALSPLFGPCCRFTPSCSAYAMEAVTLHGAARGSLLAVKRLLRCHPFGGGGYDPVPPVRAQAASGSRSGPSGRITSDLPSGAAN